MNEADAARVQNVFRRESRSLLQYARGAEPYAAGSDRKLRDEVNRIADEEAAALGELADFLTARRITVPYPGAFPVAFTDLNFVSIRFLTPRLVAEQRKDLADLEADLAATTDPAARGELDRLVQLHRRHLAELESLG